jgi:hypothetical protein
MLNSGSEYLQDLKESCSHLVAGSDLELYNEPVNPISEKNFLTMIK